MASRFATVTELHIHSTYTAECFRGKELMIGSAIWIICVYFILHWHIR